MQYQLITDTLNLKAVCEYAQSCDAVAIDTEFVRTRTLKPKLGLIQLYDGKHLVLIDPLAIDDLSPLVVLFEDQSVVKVLHSCSEDLETFWSSMKVIPSPVFDTQLAASLLNMGTTLGYAKLVQEMLGQSLDKGESRTDWLARPLRPEQCQYAANDVLYLLQLYPELRDKIASQQRTQWIYDDMRLLAEKKSRQLPETYAYLTIKNNWQLKGLPLATLQVLSAWRLKTAREKDISLNFIVREQNLIEIARMQPENKKSLSAIPDMTPKEIRNYGETVLEMVADCRAISEQDYPQPVPRLLDIKSYKKMSQNIRALCAEKATELNIPVELIGSKKQINQYLKWCWFEIDEPRFLNMQPDLLSGWRGDLLKSGLERIVTTEAN